MSAIDQNAARRAQLRLFAGEDPAGQYLELRGRRPGRALRRIGFYEATDLERVCAAIDAAAAVGDVWIGAAPRVARDGTARAIHAVSCLWMDADGPQVVERVDEFHPAPTMRVDTGSPGHELVIFAISPALAPKDAQRANRRLALALGGDMNATDAARILRPAGTFNHKHTPPRPVRCTLLTDEVFSARQVVGGLRDSHHYRARPPRPPREHVNGEAALDALVRRVRTAAYGERNGILFWAANRAIEDADDGRLDEHQALGELRDAGLAVGLREDEVAATIRSALRTTRAGS
jgi:hypothetical protein